MNLRQFRVLSAALRLPAEFTTGDLVREAGVSPEVVRKTYERHERFFIVVREEKSGPSGGVRKVRSLTPAGRKELMQALFEGQSQLPPPPIPRSPAGEPLGLEAAERVLYDFVPAAKADERTLLLREARSHLELAEELHAMADEPEPPLSAAVEERLRALQRMLACAEVLHTTEVVLGDKAVPPHQISEVGIITATLLNAAAAQNSAVGQERTRLAGLMDLMACAPEEANRIAHALLTLGRESAWRKALGIQGQFWSAQEEALLESRGEAFIIAIDHWAKIEHGDPSVRTTGAILRIAFGDKVATRHIAPWSRSVEDSVRLAAYPLALWLAKSWWRLRWEPMPWGSGPLPSSWRMAHELPMAASGFAWPSLTLESNGECIHALCRRMQPLSPESAWYFENFEASVSAEDFERAVDSFVGQVLAYLTLSAVDLGETELTRIWREIIAERADPALSVHRRLEAMLGLNRNEASKQAIQDLRDLSTEAGTSAVYELAPAYSGHDLTEVLATTREIVHSAKRIQGQIATPLSVLDSETEARATNEPPWARGLRLARACRQALGLELGPIDDATLASTLGLTKKQLHGTEAMPAQSLPLGLAIREPNTGRVDFLFRKGRRYGRRFEAARFLADALLTDVAEPWLLETETRTARQQTQRAFAVEVLAPIDALRDFLNRNLSHDGIDDAAEYFGLSPIAVQRHLENNAPEFAPA